MYRGGKQYIMSKKNIQETTEGVSLLVELFCDHIQSLSRGEVLDLGGGRHLRRTRKGFTIQDSPVPSELLDKVKYTVSSAGFASVHMNSNNKGRTGRCSIR
jgi:hypothetical protein